MPIDPRFMGLVQRLAGISQQQNMGMPIAAQQSGGSSDYGAGGPTGGGATLPGQNGQANQQTAAALNNPQTQAALEGANAPSPAAQRAANAEGLINAAQSGQPQTTAGQQQPGYGGGAIQTQQQGTALGNQQQQQPQNLTPEQAAEAQRQAQTASEQGIWDTIMQNLSGRDLKGNLLTGEALSDFQRGHALGGFLGTMGEAIGGNSTGGRLGEGVYQQAAGGLSANNADRQQEANNEFMRQALAAMGGRPTGATSNVNRGTYTPFTANTQTGSPAPTQPSTLANSGQGTMASLDESLARMRRLSGLA